MKKAFSICLPLLMAGLTVLSQHQPTAYTSIQLLQADIPQLMQRSNVPGLSAALIRDGQLVWAESFGVADADTRQPVTNSTVFEAHALSMPLFAYAVLRLVDEGRLDLDASIVRYLGKDVIPCSDRRIRLVTPRMLLNNTSGLRFQELNGEGELAIGFTPGERWEYSQPGSPGWER